jgi:hypothetical protein
MKKTIAGYAILLFLSVIASADPPLAESEKSDIEYASPQLAIEALRRKEGVEVVTEANGWIVAADQKANALWSFSPVGDPSYPAMVKRTIVESTGGAMSLEMEVSCGASKEACDSLVKRFIEQNEKIVQ